MARLSASAGASQRHCERRAQRVCSLAMPLCLAVTWVTAGVGLMLAGAALGHAIVPAPAVAQMSHAPLYRCVEETDVAVAIVGLVLCTAEPTPLLHERAVPENLQVRDGALVVTVGDGGRAAVEGVQAGDMIYRVAGEDIADADTAGKRLGNVVSESDTMINFLRRGRPYRIKLRR